MNSNAVLLKIHQVGFRWLFRVLAPRHPRGWLKFHVVYETGEPDATLWIHCHGMGLLALPDLEIVGVPQDLAGYAHGMLSEIVGAMKAAGPIQAGDSRVAKLVRNEQYAAHAATFHLTPNQGDPQHRNLLRVVDLGRGPAAGFPNELFAAHLCALALDEKKPKRRERLLRRAIELFPSQPAAEYDEGPFELGPNPGNYAAWAQLGQALWDQHRFEEGVEALEAAIARCPAWGREFARHVASLAAEEPEAPDPHRGFWREVDPRQVWQRSRGSE